jgi:hypothetical protein
MSLIKYIVLRDAILKYGNRDMSVIGIKAFSIDIFRLKAIYEIWLDVNEASVIVGASDNVVKDAISLVPTNMNELGVFVIDGEHIPCSILHYMYHSNKHAYLVKIEFILDKEEVKPYIIDPNKENKRITRFDILDIEK